MLSDVSGRLVEAPRNLVMRQTDTVGLPVRRWISLALIVVSVVAGVFVATWFAARPTIGYITSILAFITFIILGVLGAQLCLSLAELYEQRGRDLRATALADALATGEGATEPFVLYLRPFASTDEIAKLSPEPFRIQTGFSVLHGVASRRLEFETEVEYALRPVGLLVALGRPLEHRGAGRIEVTNETWQDTIRRLMKAAELIILLPSAHGGTVWEVDHLLKTGAISKTIVIDPPNSDEEEDSGTKHFSFAREWENIRRAFEAKGFRLPEDNKRGVQLFFGHEREPILQAKFPIWSQKALVHMAQDVMAHRKQHDPKSMSGDTKDHA